MKIPTAGYIYSERLPAGFLLSMTTVLAAGFFSGATMKAFSAFQRICRWNEMAEAEFDLSVENQRSTLDIGRVSSLLFLLL